jgi:hypothetical protein
MRFVRCGFCREPLDPRAAWKGAGDGYFCNEFCADAEQPAAPPVAPGFEEAPVQTAEAA